MKEIVPRVHKFVAARLSPGEALGLHFTVGIALMLLAAWVFGGIAEDVVDAEEITLLDQWLARWFNQQRDSPAFTQLMLVITHVHNTAGMMIMTAVVGIYFYLRKAHYWLVALVLSVPGGMLLNVLLKHIFQRERPGLDNALLTLNTYSFPSGHAVAATLFYGLIAAYLICLASRWRHRLLILAVACLMVALVGLSRMYLGVHYLSDVLAAIAEGCGWLAICIAGVSTWRRRRAARAPG